MKLFKYITILSLVFWMSSCGEPELPFDRFEDVTYGAYARQLSLTGEFNFFDVPNSSFDFTVEFYDEAKGANVASYDWTVSYTDNNGTGNSLPAVTFASFPSSSFDNTTSPNGYPGLAASFGFQAALDALGLTIGDINGGDAFVFQATVVKNDGASFTVSNTGTNLISSAAFKAMFTLSASVICPSSLEGTYDYSTVAWCGPTDTGTSTWTNTGSGIYDVNDFAFGAYFPCYGAGATLPGGTLQIQDACNKIAPIGASRWGELYWYNSVTVNGADLTIDWENDYGEAGVTTLTTQDGSNWPALTM